MMGFYDTVSARGCIRVDDIERIDDAQNNEHGVPLHRVHMRDGRSFTTLTSDRGGLLRRPVQLIPAEPGTRIIRADRDGVFMRTRVIAWALCLDGDVRPVTPNGINDGISRDDVYVELPDETIEAVGEWSEPCGLPNAGEMHRHFVKKGEAETPQTAGDVAGEQASG